MCLKRAIYTGSKCQSWIRSQGLWPSLLDFSQNFCLVYVCFSWGAGLSLNRKAFCYPQIALPLWYWRPCLAWQIEIVAYRVQICIWPLITLPPAPDTMNATTRESKIIDGRVNCVIWGFFFVSVDLYFSEVCFCFSYILERFYTEQCLIFTTEL